mmetsp:Transcript_86355/g.180724  ORF Transcript_86355/g.180724 Transcript_86355/m.180724 type:complete len:86 (+) Transcript_86355:54-311(+)
MERELCSSWQCTQRIWDARQTWAGAACSEGSELELEFQFEFRSEFELEFQFQFGPLAACCASPCLPRIPDPLGALPGAAELPLHG